MNYRTLPVGEAIDLLQREIAEHQATIDEHTHMRDQKRTLLTPLLQAFGADKNYRAAVEHVRGVQATAEDSFERAAQRAKAAFASTPTTPAPAPAAPIDPYMQRRIANLIRLLLREDTRTVGKLTATIADEMGLKRNATERLIAAARALPFFQKHGAGAPLRIHPAHVADAVRWAERAEALPTEHAPAHVEGLAEATFRQHAPALVRTLLVANVGLAQIDLARAHGITHSMAHRVLTKLRANERFLTIPITARGTSPVVRITDRDAAAAWLREQEAP